MNPKLSETENSRSTKNVRTLTLRFYYNVVKELTIFNVL